MKDPLNPDAIAIHQAYHALMDGYLNSLSLALAIGTLSEDERQEEDQDPLTEDDEQLNAELHHSALVQFVKKASELLGPEMSKGLDIKASRNIRDMVLRVPAAKFKSVAGYEKQLKIALQGVAGDRYNLKLESK
jgi:hypothetical protein